VVRAVQTRRLSARRFRCRDLRNQYGRTTIARPVDPIEIKSKTERNLTSADSGRCHRPHSTRATKHLTEEHRVELVSSNGDQGHDQP
jgi:hypothetical protein